MTAGRPYMEAGETYSRLTALECARGSQDMILWRCTCGTEKRVRATQVRCGVTRSCGCLQREAGRANLDVLRARLTGFSKHELYGTWRMMVDRTSNPRNDNYPDYGGRGVTVCARWRDAWTFYADIEREIGARPAGRTLDRIDNDGHYEPGNVRWATASEQALNQRRQATARARIAFLEAEVARLTGRVRDLEGWLGLDVVARERGHPSPG